ncbi:hypothetical protein KKG71_02745, partial [Patescibacteria group bacterium]|nr:hypothetical protein [Patescibacteria group bacterium]
MSVSSESIRGKVQSAIKKYPGFAPSAAQKQIIKEYKNLYGRFERRYKRAYKNVSFEDLSWEKRLNKKDKEFVAIFKKYRYSKNIPGREDRSYVDILPKAIFNYLESVVYKGVNIDDDQKERLIQIHSFRILRDLAKKGLNVNLVHPDQEMRISNGILFLNGRYYSFESALLRDLEGIFNRRKKIVARRTRAEIDSEKKRKRLLDEQGKKREKELRELRALVAKQKEELDKRKNERQQWLDRIKAEKKKRLDAERKLKEEKNRRDEAKRKMEEDFNRKRIADRKRYKKQLEDLRKQLEDAKRAALKKQKNDLGKKFEEGKKKAIGNLKDGFKKHKQGLTANFRRERQRLLGQIKGKDTIIAGQGAKISGLEETLRDATGRLSAKDRGLLAAEEKFKKSEARAAVLDGELAGVRDTNRQNQNKLKGQIVGLQDQLKAEQGKDKTNQAEQERLNKRIKTLKGKLEAERGRNNANKLTQKDLRDQITNLQGKLKGSQKSNKGNDKLRKGLEKKIKALKSKLEKERNNNGKKQGSL